MRSGNGEPVLMKGSPYWHVYRTGNVNRECAKRWTNRTRPADAEPWIVEDEQAHELTESLTFAQASERFLSAKSLRASTREDCEGLFGHPRRKTGDRLLAAKTVRDLDQVLADSDWKNRRVRRIAGVREQSRPFLRGSASGGDDSP